MKSSNLSLSFGLCPIDEDESVSTAPTSDVSVAELVAAACRRHGVEIVFGQCNPVRFHLSVPKHGMRNIGYRTENAGGAMADGYARISGQVAVVTAQNGPAATLLVAPLAEAQVIRSDSCHRPRRRSRESRAQCLPGVRPPPLVCKLQQMGGAN